MRPVGRAIPVFLAAAASLAAGDGPWARHTIDDSSRGADGVRLADVNRDGLIDIATGWEEGGVVRVCLHPGRGKEHEAWPSVTVGEVQSAEDAVFADLDGDGATDVVSCCEGKTRTVFVHWAPRNAGDYLDPRMWRTEAVPATADRQMWMFAVPMQIDGANGPDLVVGSKGSGGSIGWLRAPGDARELSAWKWHELEPAGWIMSLIARDMDGDGDRDLLVSDRKGDRRGVFWLENPGAETAAAGAPWNRREIGGAGREMFFLSLGDLDQDGREDVIGTDRSAIVWFRAAADGWEERPIPLPEGVGTGKSAAVGDLNGDGRDDLVFSCENAKGKLSGMRWLSWTGSPLDGAWSSHEIGGAEGVKFDRIELHDVDGDGDLDIICCEERDQLGVFWYENRL